MTTAILKSAKDKVNTHDRLVTLTGEEFLAAMCNGWRKLKYTDDVFFRARNGCSMSVDASLWDSKRERVVSCCALGAAAYALRVPADRMNHVLPFLLRQRIAATSNAAGNKTAAIRDVTKLVKSWESRV